MTTRSARSRLARVCAFLLAGAALTAGCECDAPSTSSPVVREHDRESPTEQGETREHDDTRDDESATPGVQPRRREAREDGTQEATEWLSDFARE